MLKELKNLFYIFIVSLFIYLTFSYYFSDSNKKKSYRSHKQIHIKIINYSKNLIILEMDTNNVVEYVEKTADKDKKDYNFWKLINDIK
ncbi:hypothetical protein N8Z31_00565 [Pelagibacteraceae bacterium]|jgi:hypothetical protein|nr:hypothetical protein [Pelagibacteraceae bacterium]|tara:strand:- start:743 stop:1006 length:264 start_codon:yes stop_codon:yes gene_type:complete